MSKVSAIYIAASAGQLALSKPSVILEAGKGIQGDRYYNNTGTFSKKLAGLPDKELTLIEWENIVAFNQTFDFRFGLGDFRRNMITGNWGQNELTPVSN